MSGNFKRPLGPGKTLDKITPPLFPFPNCFSPINEKIAAASGLFLFFLIVTQNSHNLFMPTLTQEEHIWRIRKTAPAHVGAALWAYVLFAINWYFSIFKLRIAPGDFPVVSDTKLGKNTAGCTPLRANYPQYAIQAMKTAPQGSVFLCGAATYASRRYLQCGIGSGCRHFTMSMSRGSFTPVAVNVRVRVFLS